MKILLIAPQPFFEKRGTPLAVSVLCRALSELGHSVDLVTYHIGEPWSFPAIEHHRNINIPYIHSVNKGLSSTKLFLDFFVFIKAVILLLKNRYDVVHGVEEGAIMGVVLKSLFKTKLVYDMDSSIPEQISESGSPLWNRAPVVRLADRLEGWTVQHSDLVLAVCTALKERVLSIAPDKSVAVLEDIPVVEKAPASLIDDMKRIRSELSLGDASCVVYTGTFENYQGIDLLLKSIPLVVKRQQNVIFVLAGGQAAQIETVLQAVEQMGITHNVRILGRRPMEEMPAFMALADVLVSPRTLGRNTPMKLYSYLQSGTPVVATRLLTHTQVLDDTVAVLTEATPEEFASGIARLLDDNDLGQRLASAAAEYVEKNFSYGAFMEKVRQAYTQVELQ